MPDSHRSPAVSATTASAAASSRPFRLGIAPRLGFAFLAVTVLAIAANLLAEHGTSMLETSRSSTHNPAPASGARSAPSSENPQAAVTTSGTADFLSALTVADRAVRERIDVNNPGSVSALDSALRVLSESTGLYSQTVGDDRRRDRQTLSRRTGTYRGAAAVAIQLADTRRDLLVAYRARLDSLDAAIKGAIDRSWKLFGRLIAREYLIRLGRNFEAMRQSSVAVTSRLDHDAPSLNALVADEAAFESILSENGSALRHSQGAQWETRVRNDVDGLIADRSAALVAGEQLQSAIARLSTERTELVDLARAQPSAIATAATIVPSDSRAASGRRLAMTPAPPAVVPTPTAVGQRQDGSASLFAPSPDDERARRWVAWITVIVLASMLVTCISTILSIVRPVRRLVEATRRLSTGSDAFVARGGIKELDVLAVAFNDMAQQLAAARDSADANQARLEDKVLERTNALRHLAEHDPLTQLPNRRHLLARLSSALTDATNSGHRVGVYFLDLDNFKYVNDSMGHGFGDLVLQSVARRLRDISSSFGFAARLGGDEFTLVYLSASTTIAIAEVGAAICRAFHDPLLVGERQIKMSVSVGISVYPDHERNVDALLRAADAALFRAKALGRSQLSVFSADLLEAAVARFSTEQGLRRAVEHGEFELAFQAEVSLASRTPTLVEALLRWRTPAGDLLAPGEFLSVAEESGLVLDISDWVLRTAVETAAGWHFGEWPGVRIAINVSTRQLLDTQFVDRLCGLLRQHRLPPACIELELTENVLQTGPATIEVLRQLRAYGVAIALDDFGTGYSSLSSLELLPLTRVKLDRSLIASIDTSSVSLAIARAIIGLCRNLDLEVTAEGVERPEQLAILSGNRAMHVQGYLLSRPVPGDRLIAELQALPSRVRSLLGTHALVGASALERANATDDLRVRAARG